MLPLAVIWKETAIAQSVRRQDKREVYLPGVCSRSSAGNQVECSLKGAKCFCWKTLQFDQYGIMAVPKAVIALERYIILEERIL
jgi:hypothetical protein